MDCITNNEVLTAWLVQYGPISIFLLLVFGILALPIPEETMMVLCGVLIKKGSLVFLPSLIAAYSGSMCGITFSYLLGRLVGKYLIKNFNKKEWMRSHVKRAERWFDRFGKYTLLIGYFVPGVRHFTGFSAGAMKMGFREFALYAYTGAIFWVSCFVSIGYFFGSYCFSYLEQLDIDMNILITAAICLFALWITFVTIKKRIAKKRKTTIFQKIKSYLFRKRKFRKK